MALGLVSACVWAPPAQATPATDYASATAQAAVLNLKIAANSERADKLDERYLQAQHAVVVARRNIAATQQKISATEAHVHEVRGRLGSRAALLYIGAGSGDPIGVDATSVQELGAMAQYGAAAAAKDQNLLDDLNTSVADLGSQNDTLEGQLAVAQDQQRAVAATGRAVAKANAAMMKLLDSTNASVKLLATQIEQQAQAAAATAEQAWLKRFAAEQAARRKHARGHDPSPAPGEDPAPSGPLPPPVAGALKAVAYAREQLGKPYVYAAAGPDSFDCSGLTMMAWAQSGVDMVHGSQAQYSAFPHVPLDQLQPGDLVFFGTSGPANHHVGIVVGPGLMIDAPHTGAFVELTSYFRADLVLLGARP